MVYYPALSAHTYKHTHTTHTHTHTHTIRTLTWLSSRPTQLWRVRSPSLQDPRSGVGDHHNHHTHHHSPSVIVTLWASRGGERGGRRSSRLHFSQPLFSLSTHTHTQLITSHYAGSQLRGSAVPSPPPRHAAAATPILSLSCSRSPYVCQ